MTLFQERSGGPAGPPVVLLHGLTATHRYVVMGSKALQRAGHDVLAYDARGHGASDPAPSPSAYEYADLAADLLSVMDAAGIERAVLAGASMGAHTAVRVALAHPERVAGLVIVTPAYDPEDWPGDLVRWDALSDGLRAGGVDGFVEAYGESGPPTPEKWKATLQTVLRQRLGAHEHQDAVADALKVVPRSRPFTSRDELRAIAAPTVVVADHDEPDPGHPLRVGELYASLIPGARLVVEDEGSSPIAWQGGQLSKVIAGVAAEAFATS
ncbi:esterase/lipase [Baekduia alba]|uniref:alpha/beta fold hydrolase n=1 Tax=Baekduia alba TaxID=2997333 RepID=UPI002341810C|nr:alpha/beta hydrolase [Baekduia alba]WCB93984.1 esterase/lipase [Baekduia alba]